MRDYYLNCIAEHLAWFWLANRIASDSILRTDKVEWVNYASECAGSAAHSALCLLSLEAQHADCNN